MRYRFIRSLDHIKQQCVVDKNDCWLWQRNYAGSGAQYAVYGKTGRTRIARVAWELKTNCKMAEDNDACHTCDNKSCVNPDHIYEGTRSENMKDWHDSRRKGGLTWKGSPYTTAKTAPIGDGMEKEKPPS